MSQSISRSLLQALAPLPNKSIMLHTESSNTNDFGFEGNDQHLRLAMAQLVSEYLSQRGEFIVPQLGGELNC